MHSTIFNDSKSVAVERLELGFMSNGGFIPLLIALLKETINFK
jgi:hypothetical protein